MDSRGFLDSHEPVFARGGGFDAMAWAIKPAGPLLVGPPKDQLDGQVDPTLRLVAPPTVELLGKTPVTNFVLVLK